MKPQVKRRKLRNTKLSEEDSHKSPIQKLNEDSLICILSKLPVSDLVRVERVSKSWQQIAKRSWSGFRKLSLNPNDLGISPVGTRRTNKKMMEDAVKQILIRCGRYLEEVDASDSRDDCYSLLVAEYCKNIQCINCFEFSTVVIEKLKRNCKNVFRLVIHNPRICKNEKGNKNWFFLHPLHFLKK